VKPFCAPNIDRRGRIARGLLGLALLMGAAYCFGETPWLAVLLAAAAVFCLFEALRGWCAARACGIKTKL
jgi:hypothetical protein